VNSTLFMHGCARQKPDKTLIHFKKCCLVDTEKTADSLAIVGSIREVKRTIFLGVARWTSKFM
jgi:hypothetical protein